MSKKIIFTSVFAFLLVAGGLLFAANYNVSGMSFSGVMISSGDTDWLNLAGQEGTNPTVCLQHGGGVDFDIALYNNGNEVCSNITTNNFSCCSGHVPGRGQIKVWSANGSGNYTVTIRR